MSYSRRKSDLKRNKPKHATLAEGFSARAKDEQAKLDLYDAIVNQLRTQNEVEEKGNERR